MLVSWLMSQTDTWKFFYLLQESTKLHCKTTDYTGKLKRSNFQCKKCKNIKGNKKGERATFKGNITFSVSSTFTAHSLYLPCGLQRLQEALRYDYSGSQIPGKLQDLTENWQLNTVVQWRLVFHPANQNAKTECRKIQILNK